MKTIFVFIIALIFGASPVFAQQWTSLGAGLYGSEPESSVVDRLVEIDGKLYACGYFDHADDIATWSVAYWENNAWHGHAAGIDSTVGVLDVVKYNNQILAIVTWGGESQVIAWDGSQWKNFSSEGLGASNYFTDAVVHNGELYLLQDAGGVFKYSGSTWTLLPGTDQLIVPRTLSSYKNALYIGTQDGLYKYNGTVELALQHANIYGLKVIDNTLYMSGGYLGVVGADSITGVAAFDGTTVTGFGRPFPVDLTEFTEYFTDVAKVGNKLVAGGDVHDAIFGYSRIIAYTNGKWETLGVADNLVKAVTSIGNTVYIGGWFFNISTQPFSNVAAITFPDNERTISGHAFLDLDKNCKNDPNDVLFKQHIIKAIPGPYYTLTQDDGSYTLYVGAGTYTVTATPLKYANGCTDSYTVTDSASGIEFGFTPIDDSVRIQPYIYSARNVGGRRSSMVIRVANEGGVPATSVSVRLELSNYLTLLSTSVPYEQVDDHVYVFKIDNIPMQESALILITDSVENALGQYALTRVFAIAGSGRAQHKNEVLFTSSWGVDEISEEIVGPSDPNEKLVAAQREDHPYVLLDTIDANDELTYQINFQNVGTDTAHTVVVRDTLSPFVDLGSMQMLASSHPYTMQVDGSNRITWTFTDIKLPDSSENYQASMGGVRYRIKQNPGNTPGTTILNTAAIYFDFNAPVITNATTNVIGTPSSVIASVWKSQLDIYPNPAGRSVTINLPDTYGEVELYSILGKKVLSIPTPFPATINLEALAKGLYQVQVRLRSGMVHGGSLIIN